VTHDFLRAFPDDENQGFRKTAWRDIPSSRRYPATVVLRRPASSTLVAPGQRGIAR